MRAIVPKKYTEIYVEMRIIARQIITIVGEIFKLIFLRSHVMWKNPKNAKKNRRLYTVQHSTIVYRVRW